MDLFGKILVFVNFGLSLMMAAVGGAVLFWRVDYSDAPAAADAPAGELLAREQRLDDLRGKVTGNSRAWSQIDAADAAWREARSSLLAREDRRREDRKWYADQLARLWTTDPKNPSLLVVAYDGASTTPDPANFGLPKMWGGLNSNKQPAPAALDRSDQPLKARDFYLAEQVKTDAATLEALQGLIGSETVDTELTVRLVGTKDTPDFLKKVDDRIKALQPTAKDDEGRKAVKLKLIDLLTEHRKRLNDILSASANTRGLYQRIGDEKVKRDAVAEEMSRVKLAEGQVRADSQLLLVRKQELDARVKELEKQTVTTKQP